MAHRAGLSAALTVLTFVLATGTAIPRGWNSVETESPDVSYWHRVLPATPIPDTLRERISPLSTEETTELARLVDDEKADVSVGKGGVSVGTRKADVNVGKGGVAVGTDGGAGKGADVHVGKGGVSVGTKGKGADVNVGKGGVDVGTNKGGKGADVHVGKGGVDVGTNKGGKGADVHVGGGGVSVGTRGGHKGANVHVGPHSPFNYIYAADQQMIADPSLSMFFLEKDLHKGTKLTLHFTKGAPGAAFLPRRLADAIPFSSNKLSTALRILKVSPGSEAAMAMKNTVEECETPAIDGESKRCATSLESMVDYAVSKLGTRVTVLETKVARDSGKQDYVITSISFRSKSGSRSVACHSETYAYAVYYCHETQKSKAFQVSLKGTRDGSNVQGVAVCHEDTSGWNPEHVAFKVLNVKPGAATVCHFIPEDHIVWIPSN